MKEKIEKAIFKVLCFLADHEAFTFTVLYVVFMAPINVLITVPDPIEPCLAEIDLLKFLLVNLMEILLYWVLVLATPSCKFRKLKVNND